MLRLTHQPVLLQSPESNNLQFFSGSPSPPPLSLGTHPPPCTRALAPTQLVYTQCFAELQQKPSWLLLRALASGTQE